MKKLYLLRHAKSSWDDPSLDDFDRPLEKRGKKDAPTMGKRLRKRCVCPQRILTSPAKRARKTSKLVARELAYPAEDIVRKRAIYEATVWTLLRVVRAQPDRLHTLMLVGHNPGMTSFANYLSGEHIENIPTCGVVEIDFSGDSWKKVGRRTGRLAVFEYPKKK